VTCHVSHATVCITTSSSARRTRQRKPQHAKPRSAWRTCCARLSQRSRRWRSPHRFAGQRYDHQRPLLAGFFVPIRRRNHESWAQHSSNAFDLFNGNGTTTGTRAEAAIALPPGKKAIQVSLVTSATVTVKVQNSLDKTTWFDVTSSTAPAQNFIAEMESVVPFWRVNVTSHTTSGTGTAAMVASNRATALGGDHGHTQGMHSSSSRTATRSPAVQVDSATYVGTEHHGGHHHPRRSAAPRSTRSSARKRRREFRWRSTPATRTTARKSSITRNTQTVGTSLVDIYSGAAGTGFATTTAIASGTGAVVFVGVRRRSKSLAVIVSPAIRAKSFRIQCDKWRNLQ
jgi:hypothetical protein